ncbi:hypothetical protein [Mesorhizobium sp.]|uniref:hypothetical protein n=1 Tax=Mesorhizobium sp. TaxID=1871066 RepID=UPI000FE80C73|nr:hypothetical protein [Mesorhizobium sp.]RWN59617.1 MAG: hypothetical protein EOS00_19295 [Mesorhizobium sp.]
MTRPLPPVPPVTAADIAEAAKTPVERMKGELAVKPFDQMTHNEQGLFLMRHESAIRAMRGDSAPTPDGSNVVAIRPETDQQYRTGAAGRPTSIILVLEEMLRRAGKNTLQQSLNQESEDLAVWLAARHPGAPRMTAKTIRNSLRGEYNKLKNSKPEIIGSPK